MRFAKTNNTTSSISTNKTHLNSNKRGSNTVVDASRLSELKLNLTLRNDREQWKQFAQTYPEFGDNKAYITHNPMNRSS